MDINYSVSFGDNTQAAKPPTLWAFCGVDLLPAPDDAVLLRRLDDDRRHLVRRDVAAVLDHCREFAALTDHANAAGDVVPALKGHPEHALPVLQQMAELGFMRRADELLGRWPAQPMPTDDPTPKVFVITCDRPVALERLLTSLAANPDNERFDITVIDDSRDTAHQARNSQAVTDSSGRLDITYFGMVQRAALLDTLCSALPEHQEAVRFLLDRSRWPGMATYGLARNLALLLGAGHRLMVLDDDILAEARPAPGAQASLTFGSVSSRRLSVFDDSRAMLATHPTLPDSPLSLSSDFLGAEIGQIIGQQQPQPATLHGARGNDWWSVGGHSQVLMTQCGTFGDPGTGANANWIVNLPPEDIERLLAAGPDIGATLGNQAIWMGYSRPTAMRFGVMSAITGLDNRKLMPPYLPVLRGEDFLFAIMLEKMYPDSVVLGLPWGVPHLPVDARPAPTLDGDIAEGLGIRLFADWMDTRSIDSHVGPDHILLQLAEQTEMLARTPPEPLMGLAQKAITTQHLRQLEQITRCLKQAPNRQHPQWAGFLHRVQQELVSVLQKPLDETALLSKSDQLTTGSLQTYGAEFASAIRAWPKIRQVLEGR